MSTIPAGSPSSLESAPNSTMCGLVSCHSPRKVLTWPPNTPRRPLDSRLACHEAVPWLLAKNVIFSRGPSVWSTVSSRYAGRPVRLSR